MKLAVFDIDGTLVRYSTERAFGRYLLRRGLIGPRQAMSFLAVGVRGLPSAGAQILKKNKGYLAALHVDEVARLANDFVETDVVDRLVAPVAERLRQHLQQHDHVVLLSGTLDAIARALADKVGAPRAIGTLCATANNVFAAALPIMHPFGAEKREQTERLAAELGVQHRDIVAYANSWDDLDLLRLSGTPVAVRPDRKLRRFAEDAGWEIIDEPERVQSPERAG